MDLTSAAISELSKYMTSKLPPTFSIIDEWPGPNQKMTYPTVSLNPAKAVIKLKPPELISYSDKANTVATVTSLYSVANVSIPIQVDLWFLSTDQRKLYNELFMNSLIQNPARSSDINLLLTNHHNALANYQIDDSVNFQDTSNDSFVSEYRVKYDLLCTTELIVTKEEYKMIHLTLHSKVYVNYPENVNTQINIVF